MKIYQVTDPEFRAYGSVIGGYDTTEIMDVMREQTPCPMDVVYEASVEVLEQTKLASELENGVYGQMPIQLGYCNGHNRVLSALEYHRDSEINLAVTDMILLLARREEMGNDYTLDVSNVKAFLVPAGTMVEIFATTLHYAPCQTTEDGFRCVVVLPRGTNAPLGGRPEVRSGEECLLMAKNKWLIGHPEGGLPEGTFLGLRGECKL